MVFPTTVAPSLNSQSADPMAIAQALVTFAGTVVTDLTKLGSGSGTSATGITAGTTRTQAGATALTAELNRVDTSTAPSAGSTLGDGVKLPAASAGGVCIVVNNTANLIQVYGAGADTINGVAGATGVPIPQGDVAIFEASAAGGWNFEAGLGSSGAFSIELAVDAVSAAGTTQGTATQLVAAMNNVTTVAAGSGVNLPASAPGLQVIIQNNGLNPLQVYPEQGSSDTINGASAATGVTLHQGSVGVFNCTATGAWTTEPASPVQACVNTNTATSGVTLTAANISGAVAAVDLAMTGTLGAGANAQLPTVSSLLAVLHTPAVGTSYRLRITNRSGGAFSWTVTTNTGWTLSGTMTIAQNTWREFIVQVTGVGGSAAATLTSVATGTYS